MSKVTLTARGKNIPFERLRRITGYISTLEKFNSAKQQEESQRVKHDEGNYTPESCSINKFCY